MTRAAFIGLGHMGGHMCRHVIEAGFDVAAFDLDGQAVARAAAAGARPAAGIADCVRDAEILITSLPGPPQVDDVLCGEHGAIAAMRRGPVARACGR